MGRKICISVLILAAGFLASCQKSEGDPCQTEYTNAAGRCAIAEQCESARADYQKNGIRPTFCTFNAFGSSLVCCRDGGNILQNVATKVANPRPIWGSTDQRRLSERKCEEYSRGVIEKVDYIPLIPEPETLSILAAKCDYTGVELIIGGEDAKQGEFPHMAAIGWANFEGGYTFSCGGSLISPLFVVSAGHCLQQAGDTTLQDPSPVVVRLGDQNLDPSVEDGADPIDVPIRRAHKHPDYDSPKKYNDIALFELASAVTFNANVRPACLWTRPDFGNHRKAIAIGWGVTSIRSGSQKTSKELQKVSLSLLENDYCDQLLADERNRNWPNGFVPSQMCAGELRGGKDTCQGDSGSPLQVAAKDNQCIFYVIGVTSFGRRCGEKGQPAIYTRISAYLEWIEKTVWPEES